MSEHYRMTPERKQALDNLFRLNDAARPPGVGDGAALPPVELFSLERQWAEEDEVIARYGYLRKFRWTVTDATDSMPLEFKGVATKQEALTKAFRTWAAAGHSCTFPVTTVRHED